MTEVEGILLITIGIVMVLAGLYLILRDRRLKKENEIL